MMKRIFLLLIALSSFILSEVAFSNIDECKTDVYFGNGILTDRQTAKYNAFKILKPAIIEKIGIENFDKKIGKVDYAYNRSDGQIVDLLESLLQKADGTGLENINGYTAAFSLLAG